LEDGNYFPEVASVSCADLTDDHPPVDVLLQPWVVVAYSCNFRSSRTCVKRHGVKSSLRIRTYLESEPRKSPSEFLEHFAINSCGDTLVQQFLEVVYRWLAPERLPACIAVEQQDSGRWDGTCPHPPPHQREYFMKRFRSPLSRVCLALALVVTFTAQADTVLNMDLDQLCDRADRIFRGSVISIQPGTVKAGGAELPTMTYRLRVDESFKGFSNIVDGEKIAQITMVGGASNKPIQVGDLRLLSALPELPRLTVGQEYLLLTTRPSTIGLSTTVGLGQGCFSIQKHGNEEVAVNLIGNAGLFDGPVNYQELAAQIRATLEQ